MDAVYPWNLESFARCFAAALVRRGSLTLWVTEEALAAWHAPATGKRGGQPVYADVAIETGLALRLVFHQPLRQTKGAMRSIVGLLGLDLPIPDHTTFSQRGGGLTVLRQRVERNEPLHLLVDSTGVKIYGEGEWLDQKHGIRSRRRWRKLHLTEHPGSGGDLALIRGGRIRHRCAGAPHGVADVPGGQSGRTLDDL